MDRRNTNEVAQERRNNTEKLDDFRVIGYGYMISGYSIQYLMYTSNPLVVKNEAAVK